MPKDNQIEDKVANDEDELPQDANEIARVNVRLPQFWSNSPATWFIQAEAQFGLGRITSDAGKYNHVVASLPQDVAESITDILENPPATSKYNKLKTILIERHSLSIEARIKKLLSDELMGDKKPSEFYRYLKQLAGTSGTVGEELIKKLWFSRLPHLVSIALIPQKEEAADTILPLADQIFEAMQTSNVSVIQATPKHSMNSQNSIPSESSFSSNSNVSSNDERYNNLEREIKSIKAMIANININNNRSRSRSRGSKMSKDFQRHSSQSKRFSSKNRLCWYHFRYGAQATKCTSPCEYNKESTSSNGSRNTKN